LYPRRTDPNQIDRQHHRKWEIRIAPRDTKLASVD
jgi:hypothetical protein